MALKEKIKQDLKEAMQQKEAEKMSVLRLLSSAIFNKEKEKRAKLSKEEEDSEKLDQLSQLSDEEILEVVSSEAKKRRDSIEQYRKGGRDDLAEEEEKELEILAEYLPAQMSEDEIRGIVKKEIEELGASGPQEAGRVMGEVMPKVKGKADGSLVNKLVQEELKNL